MLKNIEVAETITIRSTMCKYISFFLDNISIFHSQSPKIITFEKVVAVFFQFNKLMDDVGASWLMYCIDYTNFQL